MNKAISKNRLITHLNSADVYPDTERGVVKCQDGTFKVRHSYFYRHGRTAEKWAEDVAKALPGCKVIGQYDHFRMYPKLSYLEVVVDLSNVTL
jgi:hypothetical protein